MQPSAKMRVTTKTLLDEALALGAAERIAVLLADVERAIGDFPPDGGSLHLDRLHDQRQRLLRPDLRTIAAVAVTLCEDDGPRAQGLSAHLDALAPSHPDLAPLRTRLAKALEQVGARA